MLLKRRQFPISKHIDVTDVVIASFTLNMMLPTSTRKGSWLFSKFHQFLCLFVMMTLRLLAEQCNIYVHTYFRSASELSSHSVNKRSQII